MLKLRLHVRRVACVVCFQLFVIVAAVIRPLALQPITYRRLSFRAKDAKAVEDFEGDLTPQVLVFKTR